MRTLLRCFVVGSCVVLPTLARAQTTDWAAVESLPMETRVRIHERGGKGWAFADGRLLLVKEDEITILKNSRAVVIPKASIGRIEQKRRDPVVEGAVFGALYGILAHALWAAEGNAAGGIAISAGLGAFIDWRIDGKRTVYRAPKPLPTLLRLSF